MFERQITWNFRGFTRQFASSSGVGQHKHSPEFSLCLGANKIKFTIQVYPNGDENVSKNHVSLFLFLQSATSMRFKYNAEFCLLDAAGEVKFSETYSEVRPSDHEVGSGWGIASFIQHNALFNRSAELLPQNTLSIMLKVSSDIFELQAVFLIYFY